LREVIGLLSDAAGLASAVRSEVTLWELSDIGTHVCFPTLHRLRDPD